MYGVVSVCAMIYLQAITLQAESSGWQISAGCSWINTGRLDEAHCAEALQNLGSADVHYELTNSGRTTTMLQP